MLKGQSFNRLSGYRNEPYVSLITNDTTVTPILYLKKSKILKIEDLFQYQAALFMYDYKYEKLPPPLEELSKKMMNFQIQEQPDNQIYYKYLSITPNLQVNYLYITFPPIWNKWTKLITENGSRKQIKQQIKRNRFENYISEVHYTNTMCKDCVNK